MGSAKHSFGAAFFDQSVQQRLLFIARSDVPDPGFPLQAPNLAERDEGDGGESGVEEDHHPDQAVEAFQYRSVRPLSRCSRGGQQRLHGHFAQRVQNLVLRGVVVVHAGHREARGPSDLTDGGPVKTVGGKAL